MTWNARTNAPAVGMELGGGDVELGEKLPLETSKGKLELHLLE